MFGNILGMAGTYEQLKVANFKDQNFTVDTCRVTDGLQPFETAVKHDLFDYGDWIVVEFYETKEKALIGHDKWVETMKSPPPVLEDCANSEIQQILEIIVGKRTIAERGRNDE